ncbi:hypothetical protein ACWFPY_17865 [Nocardia fluminea]
MALVDKISALATRIGAEVKTKYTLPGGGVPVADLSNDARAVGFMLWQTYGLHAVGIGQQDIGYVVPFAMRVTGVRYWCKTAGTGGTAAIELRKNGIAGGNTISSSSAAPAAATPTLATPNHDLAAGDLIWVYQTAVNSTTLGVQLAAEIIGRRI